MYSYAKKQLFLLHFAGGNSYSYNFLRDTLSNDFEFIPLELPGRGKRFTEGLLTSKKDAISDYVNQIQKHRNGQPYIIFGHSMGATLGLSATKKMEEVNDAPTCLIVSGNAGPGVKSKDQTNRHLLDEVEFKKELKDLGGFPEEVLGNKELFDFINPIIRSDFEILEKDNFSEKELVIRTPIKAIMGDEEKTSNEIENWQKFTSGSCTFELMIGNHFFIHHHINEIATIIKEIAKKKAVISKEYLF